MSDVSHQSEDNEKHDSSKNESEKDTKTVKTKAPILHRIIKAKDRKSSSRFPEPEVTEEPINGSENKTQAPEGSKPKPTNLRDIIEKAKLKRLQNNS